MNLAEDQKTFLSGGGEQVGEQERVLVLGTGHHVQKLIARRPNVLK